MISARDFVLSYSEWFSYIADHYGDQAVEGLWAALSDEFLLPLRKLIAEKGFEGMVEHWSRTLKEESDCDILCDNEWLHACKTGEPTSCNFDYSGMLVEHNLLANVAYRAGNKLQWDPQNLKATNCPEADTYIRREYREGWTLSPPAS